MAQAKEHNEQTPAGGETPSMEEILQSIRGVISGDEPSHDDNEVLELTEVIEEPIPVAASAAKVEQPTPETPVAADTASNQEKSILDDIDAALDTGTTATPAAAPPAPEPLATDTPAEKPVVQNTEESPKESTTPAQPQAQTANELNANITIPTDTTTTDDMLETKELAPITNNSDTDSAKTHPGNRLLDEQAALQSSGSLKALVSTIADKHIDSPHTRNGTSLEELVIEAMKPFLAEWLNKNLPVIVKKIVEKEVKRLIPKEEDEY